MTKEKHVVTRWKNNKPVVTRYDEPTCNGTTHYICDEMLKKHGGKAVCCGCTKHYCNTVTTHELKNN